MERRKKKSIGLLLAAVLLVGAAVGVTLAYLTATSGPVENTFVAGKLNTSDFILTEHEVTKDAAGKYTLGTNTTDKNDYIVVPGNDLPKDPYVTVIVDSDITAYLFIEVIDTLPTELTWNIDNAHWMPLMNASNQQVEKDGHPIYVYTNGGDNPTPKVFTGALTAGNTNIIKDKTIKVPADFDVSKLNPAEGSTEAKTLKFNAYLCQSTGFENAAEAWEKCFVELATQGE